MGIEVLIPIFGVLTVLVPITGLTVVLTLRFGGKPFVETLAREMRNSGLTGGTASDLRIVELSEQVEELSHEVRRLREEQAFDKRLLGTAAAGASSIELRG